MSLYAGYRFGGFSAYSGTPNGSSSFISNSGGNSSGGPGYQDSLAYQRQQEEARLAAQQRQMDLVDPWNRHRKEAGTLLAGEMANDPTKLFQNKLEAMSTGHFTGSDDPSYQWRQSQGNQAVERSLASRGMLDSGNAVNEIMQHSQGMASQEYGAQFNRMLQGLAGTSAAYSTRMSHLGKLAGVDISPVAAAQLQITGNQAENNASIQQQQVNLGFQSSQYQLWDQNNRTNLSNQAQQFQQQSAQAEQNGIRDALTQKNREAADAEIQKGWDKMDADKATADAKFHEGNGGISGSYWR